MGKNLVASGPALGSKKDDAGNQLPKFFDFPATSLKAEDYDHLPSTTVGKGDTAKKVPVCKVSPADILVNEYTDDTEGWSQMIADAGDENSFRATVTELVNDAQRNAVVSLARKTIAEAKTIPMVVANLLSGLADSFNVWSRDEAKRGRASVKEEMNKLVNDPEMTPERLFEIMKAKFGSM